ncbi:MAG: hypothetical protein KJO10_04265, partial [Gammaproteobacteria bacterium]|nr:hypothetical protein [Gammaproteobacteria bacterium]
LNIGCNDASNGGLGNCDGIMATIPDVNFNANGDDTQGGTITFTSTGDEFEITQYIAVDSDNFDKRITLSVNSTEVGVATVFGNGSAVNVTTDDHSTTEAVFTFFGSGGIDDIEVCRDDPLNPGIDIEKLTNGNQADGANDGDVPQIAPGDVVTWTYQVMNTGDVPFGEAELTVTDDRGVVPVLDTSSDTGGDLILSPGETWIYTAIGQALELSIEPTLTEPGCNDGRPTYVNMGKVVTSPFDLMDTDPSHYCNPPQGGEGCTPGFWKQEHHFAAWLNPPYDPNDLFSDHFEDAFPGMTLLEVLEQGGGGLEALGRHTVAALLNTATADVSYGFGTSQDVINAFNAVHPGSNDDYNDLKNEFSGLNEQGCPINGKYPPSNQLP